MLIDTHAHLTWETYAGILDEVLARAKAAGVEKMIVPGTDIESSRKAVELAKQYPGVIYAAVGIHPEELENSGRRVGELREIIKENRQRIVAVGEVGTDRPSLLRASERQAQVDLFRGQCEIALEYDLPVIVHTRQSLKETLEVLDALPKLPRGQFHCFSYDEPELAEVLERGFYTSFCANVTWSKRLQRVAPKVPAERLLTETDSPFMTPLELKPKANEPGNVRITALKLAELRGESLEQLEKDTTENAKRLYKL